MRNLWIALICGMLSVQAKAQKIIKKAIPDKLVVLTFDDAVLSHYTNVAPLLKKYHFGGTFFIAEFLKPSFNDKTLYLSWEQIGQLAKMGFEVANHTRNHTHVTKMKREQFIGELDYIEQKAKKQHIKKKMISFAYPGYDVSPSAFAVLEKKGYLFARIGGGRAYNPGTDHPYLIPSFSTSGDNSLQVFEAFAQAKNGKIVVLTVHGVPDEAHPWVNTPLHLFEQYLKFLHDNQYKVIALRDLKRYIHAATARKRLSPQPTKTTNTHQ